MFKSLTIATVAMLFATVAYADSTSGSQSGAWSQSGVQINNSAGHKPVGAAIAPGLIAGGITCLGSWSIGSGWAGFGGSTGMTYPDRYCNAREDAKYMLLLGSSRAAAKERLCDMPRIRAAYAAAGEPCIRDKSRRVASNGKRTGTVYYATSAGYAKPQARKIGLSQRAQ